MTFVQIWTAAVIEARSSRKSAPAGIDQPPSAFYGKPDVQGAPESQEMASGIAVTAETIYSRFRRKRIGNRLHYRIGFINAIYFRYRWATIRFFTTLVGMNEQTAFTCPAKPTKRWLTIVGVVIR